MKRSVITATIASLGAAAFVLTSGVAVTHADSGKTAKISDHKSSHGYGQYKNGHSNPHYRGHDDHNYRGGHNGHTNGHHNYRPSYGHHQSNPDYSHRNYGAVSYTRHGYANHRGYYCPQHRYRTSSYSIFYSHIYQQHHVPRYDIGAQIVFDPIKLFFTFGGHG